MNGVLRYSGIKDRATAERMANDYRTSMTENCPRCGQNVFETGSRAYEHGRPVLVCTCGARCIGGTRPYEWRM